jgi:hypothetical protein
MKSSNVHGMIRETMHVRGTVITCTEHCCYSADKRSYVVSETRGTKLLRQKTFRCAGYFDFSQAEPARALAHSWIYEQ